MKKYGAFILTLAFLIFLPSCSSRPNDEEKKTAQSASKTNALYHCSMHPSITSDQPGTCPICGMALQKAVGGFDAAPTKEAKPKEGKILFYRHPMRADVTSSTPQKDEMGMDYVPVYDDTAAARTGDVKGRGSFSLSQERQQLIGVTSEGIQVRELTHEIRSSGRVAFDPDLYTAIEEYRQTAVSISQLENGPLQSQSKELLKSSKTKLQLMGLSNQQIRDLASPNTDVTNLLLPKNAAWVYAEVFEYEVASIKPGMRVDVDTPSIPGKSFGGKVSSISPVVNSPSRTIRVRALVANPQGILRPDMFVNARIISDLGKRLAVPESAVLHSGEDAFVFLVEGGGTYVPIKVRLGVKSKEYYEVLEGLKAGETVITSANFLIDSESKLQSVLKSARERRP